MNFIISKRIAIAACGLMLVITGCGKPQAKLIPVKGVVFINDKPAEGIMVQCSPVVLDENTVAPTSQALTDAEGKFVLFTLQNEEGAVAGEHRVSLYDTLADRPAQGEVASKPPRLDDKFAAGAITLIIAEGQDLEIKATGPTL